MNKKIWFSILMLFCSISAFAVDLVVKAPSIVTVNQKFQIVYIVDAIAESFVKPVFPDFKVIAGPVESTSMAIGTGGSSQQHTFTYFVQATKEGVFEIPSAEIKLNDGTTRQSKKTSIEVIKESAQVPANAQQGKSSNEISANDLFVKMELNRTSVYKGEPVVLTIKLYSHNVPVSSLTNLKMSTLTGFDFQELNVSSNESTLHQQKYNGRVYLVAVLGRILLHPLRAGEIKIEPVEAGVSIQQAQASRGNDVFELFYGSPSSTINKQLKSAPVTLSVKDFPAGSPASFNGASGTFTMISDIDKTQVTANQPITYSITVSGTGNFKQVTEPLIAFPDRFDRYDPKVTNNVQTGTTGGTGSKKFEYVVIPRSAGEYEIPAVEYSYFDTQKASYITLKTKPVNISVEKDPTGATQSVSTAPLVTGKKVEHLSSDILFIKTGMLTLKPAGYMFFGSTSFWLLFVAVIALFAIVCFIMVKTGKDKQNIALMRNRKANKMAISRLKQSSKLLKVDDKVGFYEEVSRAVWGYIGDKLNMQGSELSRDNVQEKLGVQNVPQENIDMLLTVIDNCEYARYAPGGNKESMEDMYNKAIVAISKLENLK